MGAWIEIINPTYPYFSSKSRPSWARGLKSFIAVSLFLQNGVAPLMGAWIEIAVTTFKQPGKNIVAPLMGAWIEI